MKSYYPSKVAETHIFCKVLSVDTSKTSPDGVVFTKKQSNRASTSESGISGRFFYEMTSLWWKAPRSLVHPTLLNTPHHTTHTHGVDIIFKHTFPLSSVRTLKAWRQKFNTVESFQLRLLIYCMTKCPKALPFYNVSKCNRFFSLPGTVLECSKLMFTAKKKKVLSHWTTLISTICLLWGVFLLQCKTPPHFNPFCSIYTLNKMERITKN